MAKLPSLTARKVIRALRRAGFIEDRQEGSHLMLIHPETKARTVIPTWGQFESCRADAAPASMKIAAPRPHGINVLRLFSRETDHFYG